MNKKYHYIYKITCSINNKFYIGMHSTDNLEDNYMGSGTYLRNSIKKYGRENFVKEILEFFQDRNSLAEREKEIVNEEILKCRECMNIKPGGFGGCSKGHQAKMGKLGGLAYGIRLKNDSVFREKIRNIRSAHAKKLHANGAYSYKGFIGKTHSEETKLIIGLSSSNHQKGEGNSQFGTCWMHNESKNIKIKKDELDLYLSSGWTKGRKMKFKQHVA